MPRLIRAAGGVVLRPTNKGRLKILMTHRPRYDDWSLPKGKAEPKETSEQTAVREVLEETGYHCRIIAPLGKTRYPVNGGTKEVAWFAMRPLPNSQGFTKNLEVDRIRWLTRKKAAALLDYERDRELVMETDLNKLARTGTLFLVRHATAGDRSKWKGNDLKRPLTKSGVHQAAAIAARLAPRGIERILSSPYDRCTLTMEPLSKLTRAPIELSDTLAEKSDLDAAWELVESMIGYNTVLCSHGDVIPSILSRLMWAGLSIESRFYCSKGSTWEVNVDGGKFTTGTYVPPPEK
ncbi:MAG: NUDIX domain-containing protein [Acidimicrobiia bacterium]